MRPFVIKNVKIVLETKTINLGYLLIRDGVIAEVGEQPVPEALVALQTLDGEGMFLCPGFVDLHAHGGGDHDFMDGEADDILCAARAENKVPAHNEEGAGYRGLRLRKGQKISV